MHSFSKHLSWYNRYWAEIDKDYRYYPPKAHYPEIHKVLN